MLKQNLPTLFRLDAYDVVAPPATTVGVSPAAGSAQIDLADALACYAG